MQSHMAKSSFLATSRRRDAALGRCGCSCLWWIVYVCGVPKKKSDLQRRKRDSQCGADHCTLCSHASTSSVAISAPRKGGFDKFCSWAEELSKKQLSCKHIADRFRGGELFATAGEYTFVQQFFVNRFGFAEQSGRNCFPFHPSKLATDVRCVGNLREAREVFLLIVVAQLWFASGLLLSHNALV